VVTGRLLTGIGSQVKSAARLFLGISIIFAACAASGAQSTQSAGSAQPVDEITADKLVWSSLAALDQANRTGNYSVLRDLGAPTFQANNSAATLGGIFEHLRNLHLDLANTFIVSPIFETAPAVQGNILRAKGIFPLRPTAIGFDLLFQNNSGEWRLLGISVVPLVRTKAPPGR
jgi:hypothetical protein